MTSELSDEYLPTLPDPVITQQVSSNSYSTSWLLIDDQYKFNVTIQYCDTMMMCLSTLPLPVESH